MWFALSYFRPASGDDERLLEEGQGACIGAICCQSMGEGPFPTLVSWSLVQSLEWLIAKLDETSSIRWLLVEPLGSMIKDLGV